MCPKMEDFENLVSKSEIKQFFSEAPNEKARELRKGFYNCLESILGKEEGFQKERLLDVWLLHFHDFIECELDIIDPSPKALFFDYEKHKTNVKEIKDKILNGF